MTHRLATLRGTLLIVSISTLLYGPASAQLSVSGAPQIASPPGKHLAPAVFGEGSPSFAVHRGSAPVNDNCEDAEIVPLEANSSVARFGDNTGATNQFGFGNSVWEAFTTTECLDVTVAYCGTAPAFSAAFTYLFVGCPLNNLVYIPDQNVNPFTCGDGNFTLTFPQVPPGTYYYGVLQGTGATGPYQLTFSGLPCSAVPPVNDVCEGATELVPGVVCNATTGDVSGALVSGASLPPVSCTFVDGDASDDVWFSFVATASEHTIEVTPSQRFDAVIDLRAGQCGETVPIACADAVGRGGAESVTFDGLVVGTTYFIRVYDWYAGLPETSTFQICVLAPAPVCDANAGTLVAASTPCLQDGAASLSATVNGDAVVPAGYQLLHVLTQGEDLVILATGTEPLFTVDATGLYTIHTLVYSPSTLDLDLIEPGVTTGFDVNALLIQGGGSICGSLDVAGAAFNVDLCCTAAAGNIAPDAGIYCLGEDGTVVVSATPDGNAVVPDGYLLAYALSEGPDLVVVALGGDPVFTVSQAGEYIIHTLVIDPNTIDPGQVELGVTTGNDIHAQLIQGGGVICGAIDLVGAAISVELCCEADAGSLTVGEPVCLLNGSATLNAVPNGDQVVPDGYQVVYALTQGVDLVIINAGAAPEFTVDATGTYTIHTLVYDPNTLDLSLVEFGVSNVVDVDDFVIQCGGAICGSLDVAGAAYAVEICCDAQAGTLLGGTTNCFTGAPVQIAALPNGDAVVPSGFETLYVLTSGPELLIIAVDAAPAFEVDALGDYTIHTLVYDPSTLDLSGLELGVTTGFDVNALLIQGGGEVCASLDVAGAAFLLLDCSPSNDECGSATVLNVQLPENCPANATAGDNTYATQDGVDPTCDGTNAYYADVWYVFNSGNNTEVNINFDSGTMTDHVMVVSDACGGNEVLCAIAPGANTPLVVAENTDYRVRVYSNLQYGEPGQFAICISGTVPTVICDGGDVQTSTGEVDLVVCQDEQADLVVMVSNSTSTEDYTFILTDEADVIVTPLAGDVLDFNSAGLGTYRVWGVSHNGTLLGSQIGAPLDGLNASGDCISVSENFVTVVVEICTGVQQTGSTAWGLHPNPGNGDFTLRYAGGDALVVLEVIDMGGRVVQTRQFPIGSGQVQQVSLAGQLAQGFYTLRLSAEGRTATLRVAVQ